jgi:hypothetical protein
MCRGASGDESRVERPRERRTETDQADLTTNKAEIGFLIARRSRAVFKHATGFCQVTSNLFVVSQMSLAASQPILLLLVTILEKANRS